MINTINLDRIRTFRFGMKAISMIEKKLNKPIAKLGSGENLTMDEAAIVGWAGLFHEDKELTPDKLIDLIDEYSNIPSFLEVTFKAFGDAFGSKEEDRANEGKNE